MRLQTCTSWVCLSPLISNTVTLIQSLSVCTSRHQLSLRGLLHLSLFGKRQLGNRHMISNGTCKVIIVLKCNSWQVRFCYKVSDGHLWLLSNKYNVLQANVEYILILSETEEAGHAINITHLPSEIMLTVFSYLNPQELCRCSQVSTKWSQLAKTGSLWKHLYPVHWARGKWLKFQMLWNFTLPSISIYYKKACRGKKNKYYKWHNASCIS